MTEVDEITRIKLESATFRQLVTHLQKRNDVQNIDLMNLSGFCRNCLSKWYKAAAEEQGLEIDMDSAREYIYGISYDEWKEKYQAEATAEQQETFKKVLKNPNLTSCGKMSWNIR